MLDLCGLSDQGFSEQKARDQRSRIQGSGIKESGVNESGIKGVRNHEGTGEKFGFDYYYYCKTSSRG